MAPAREDHAPVTSERLESLFDQALMRLEQARPFAKLSHQGPVLDLARRLMAEPGGFDALYARAERLDRAGLFTGTDWAQPETLLPTMTANAVRLGERSTVLLECLNDVRMLAIATGDYVHPGLSAEQAHHFLNQVLALNLDLVFGAPSEADRVRLGALADTLRAFYQELIARIGYGHILDRLIDEVWRILVQRPLLRGPAKEMITQIAAVQTDPAIELEGSGRGADRLVSALFSPTNASREDPGLEVYRERIAPMDAVTLRHEALGFARAMHDTGLVSAYHAVFLRHALGHGDDLVQDALGLSATGRDSYLTYQDLVRALIEAAVHPETADAAYGLAMVLERGILHFPAIAPALWRQLALPLCPEAETRLAHVFGTARPAREVLAAGVLGVLGQPLGVGQGNNPTCQAARAISLWSLNDPDFLLQLVAWAARDDEIVLQFEERRISSRGLVPSPGSAALTDVDPVSLVLVPHLDRIYLEMGRLCQGRGEDPHKWVNPEFHGWWTGHGFAIAIEVATGALADHEAFLRLFYATYHPLCNGNQPVIHAQPAGIASTDTAARFVGWHAISILRVGLDPEGVVRVYFFNPNNDSGQDWGQDIAVSTEGHGERFGESSLPVPAFASRLYIFHYDPNEVGDPSLAPDAEIAEAMRLSRESWAQGR